RRAGAGSTTTRRSSSHRPNKGSRRFCRGGPPWPPSNRANVCEAQGRPRGAAPTKNAVIVLPHVPQPPQATLFLGGEVAALLWFRQVAPVGEEALEQPFELRLLRQPLARAVDVLARVGAQIEQRGAVGEKAGVAARLDVFPIGRADHQPQPAGVLGEYRASSGSSRTGQ